MPHPANSESVERVPVWDRFVRVFHWSLVACVTLNLFVLEEGEAPHRWAGYAAAALVAARVVWGFVGSRHARFADFFPTPSRVATHLRALRAGRHLPTTGHNPMGAVMMLALMGLVLSLGATGYMMGTDAFWGEEWLEELHESLSTLLLASVGLHAAAALVMSRVERTPLVKAMVTGVKERRRAR